MFSIGWFELLLVALVALLIFGAEELPSVVRRVARVIGRIRRMFVVIERDWTMMMDEADRQSLVPKDTQKDEHSVPTSHAYRNKDKKP